LASRECLRGTIRRENLQIMDRKIGVLILLVSMINSACEEDKSTSTINQFENPQDVALICYDEKEGEPLPIDCCGDTSDGKCSYGISTAKLYAFVTQTTPGEVAVVDVEEQEIVDQEKSIPYNTFIPVGGQPNDIAATTDGTKVYTVNYETGDMSIIRVVDKEKKLSVIDSPYLSPANSINLEGPAARLALVKYPEEYEDKVALVTQPTLGRIVVLALDPDDCEDPETQVDGCVKGYLYLKATVEDEETGEPKEVVVNPYAITSADGQSVYVGSYDTPVIIDIQLESLIAEALALEDSKEIDPDKVINEIIDISPYRVRMLSIEPKKRRWIYGIENDKGGVIAMDLAERISGSGAPLNINELNVSGIARSVKLLELAEDDEAGPYTFNGTFAIVTTTTASLAVIDIEDNDLKIDYFYPHRIRSSVDLSEEEGIPKIEKKPTLSVNKSKIEEGRVDDYVQLVEDDAGVGCDAGAKFKSEYDDGVRFRCDPYQSKRDTWTLTWRGPIGLSGAGIITNIDEKDTKIWKLLNADDDKDLCKLEIYAKDAVDGYPGDRLIITSKPTPIEGKEDFCKEKYDDDYQPTYRIVGVSKYPENDKVPNVIEFEKDGGHSPKLFPECYGQALEFKVQASDHWTIRGPSINPQKGRFVEDECVYDEAPASVIRVYEGKTYKNRYIIFKMQYGEEWEEGPRAETNKQDEVDTDVEAVYEFQVEDGYKGMFSFIGGTNITDIEMSPDSELMLIDQAGEGLIMFDLLDSFSTIGGHIR
jgi:hypothetical protein